jgi:hypothetical protein
MLMQQIPANFVQSCIPKEHLNSHKAVVLGPHAKFSQIEVEMNQTDMFFVGGWSQFLEFHGISDANCLLLRYEGNMVFTVKVFEPNGCQRVQDKETRFQQNEQNMSKLMIFLYLLAMGLIVNQLPKHMPFLLYQHCLLPKRSTKHHHLPCRGVRARIIGWVMMKRQKQRSLRDWAMHHFQGSRPTILGHRHG